MIVVFPDHTHLLFCVNNNTADILFENHQKAQEEILLKDTEAAWRPFCTVIVCLFDLILYVPSTIFQLNRDRECVLLKDHNAVKPVRLEPGAPRSRVKHSTTEQLRSHFA